MIDTSRKFPNFKKWWAIAGWIGGGTAILMLGVIIGFAVYSPQVIRQFNSVISATSNNTLIFDADGNLIATVEGTEDRHMVPISRIHPFLQKAVVAIEDRRFFSHKGTDPVRLLGALWADLKSMSYQQGASTITQQLVKLTLLSSERTLTRKIKEIFMAIALERTYPKLKLLEFYLNRVYLGKGVYGVEKASRAYFRKSAADLSLREAAFLAALIKKPEGYLSLRGVKNATSRPTIPVYKLKRLRKRQVRVIRSMVQMGWIKPRDLRRELKKPLVVYWPRTEATNAPYFVQEVLKEMREKLSISQVSGRGYRVYTTLDGKMQKIAEKLISEVGRKNAGRKNAGGKNIRKRQASLIAINPYTGAVRAMVGGIAFQDSQFNRTTQALRQPGSAIKPLLYAAALEKRFNTNTVFVDEPIRYAKDRDGNFYRLSQRDDRFDRDPGPEEGGFRSVYAPRNYNDKYGLLRLYPEDYRFDDRRMTLARAFELSSNVIAVQLLDKLGFRPLVKLGRRMNLNLRSKMGLCIALGCSEVSLAALTAAYATFANGGMRVDRFQVLKVTNSQGDLIYRHASPPGKRAISSWTAFQMRTLLSGVLTRGTGTRAFLGRPAGGKTGTNDGPRDIWFIGFTPTLAAGVWLGTDGQDILPNESGGLSTARIWRKFMTQALPRYDGQKFPQPEAPYIKVEICNIDGQVAQEDCPDRSDHFFRESEFTVKLFASNEVSGTDYPATGIPFDSTPNGMEISAPNAKVPANPGLSQIGSPLPELKPAGSKSTDLKDANLKGSVLKNPVLKNNFPPDITREIEKTLNIHEITTR
ncbi:MAG: penicillin-binding protein [SAR324 cluster bacterium]|nr:penicillin-binding protein [SAR324 cluster bacterium]